MCNGMPQTMLAIYRGAAAVEIFWREPLFKGAVTHAESLAHFGLKNHFGGHVHQKQPS